MYGAVAGKAVFPFENRAAHHHVKVAFTGGGRTCMASMACTIVHNHYLAWIEGPAQCIFYFLAYRHFFLRPPSILVPIS